MSTQSIAFPRRKLAPLFSRLRAGVARNELYAGALAVCFLNGVLPRMMLEVDQLGWWAAVSETFGISILVWAAVLLGSQLLLSAEPSSARPGDWLNTGLIVCMASLPVASLSWVGMGWLSWCLCSSASDRETRAGWIFLALTFPMFWSREFFSLFSEWILQVEATMVGTLMGSAHEGNLVQFANGSGFMQIWPACSSFANVSLAVLCWSLFSNLSGAKVQHGVLWCLIACSAVVAINLARISLIGFFPQRYDLLHGSIGNSVAGWLTLGASLLICYVGVRASNEGTGVAQPARSTGLL